VSLFQTLQLAHAKAGVSQVTASFFCVVACALVLAYASISDKLVKIFVKFFFPWSMISSHLHAERLFQLRP